MANSLDNFMIVVRQQSASGHFDQLYDYCSKNSEILVKNGQHLDDALATLIPISDHSIGVLSVLCAKLSNGGQDVEQFHSDFKDFITNCNGEQIRFATDMFAEYCHLYTQRLIESRQAIRGLLTLSRAIQKVQICPSQLTSIHADLCQLSLISKCVKPALEFLDVDVTDISREGGHFDVKYFLLYYYYGGMIYASLKNFERALYFFETALTTHSLAVSHIMLESYKKYVLISLILYGKIQPLPKYTPQVISRFIKPWSQPYLDLVSAYGTNSPEELNSQILKHSEVFNREKNMGLVKQLLVSLYKKNIQRLTKTFLTLSLSDMASRVHLSSPAEAEKYILRMMEDGEIFASINQKDGMVFFLDNPERYNSAKFYKKLEEEMKACIASEEKLRHMENEISVNPKYVQKIRNAEPE